MSKKYLLIISVAILGALTAGSMWFMTNRTMMPGTVSRDMMMDDPIWNEHYPVRDEVGMMAGSEMVSSKLAPYPGMYGNDALSVSDRAVQKFSYHTLVVNDVSQYLQKSKDYFASIGGVVLSYNQGSNTRATYGSLSVKVPVDKFDEAVSEVSKDAKKVIDESVSSNDVTGQVVSIEERIQQLKDEKSIQEAALIDAKTAIEKQKLELEIARLDRQITQMEDNQKSVQDQVDYATMNVNVADSESYFNYDGPRPLTEVFQQAWWSLRGATNAIVAFLIWTVVYAIIWVPVLLLARWIWMKVKSSKNTIAK